MSTTPKVLQGAEPWRQIAASRPEEEVMEYILTGWQKKGWHDNACPLPRLFDRGDNRLRVLDLGCGLGRTLHGLRQSTRWRLAGFDSPEMIARAQEAISSEIWWTSDWEEVRSRRWDCVHACFVFQHVTPAAIAQYCRDLPAMTSQVVVRGRDWNDHSRLSVRELLRPLEQAGYCALESDRDGDHATTLYRKAE